MDFLFKGFNGGLSDCSLDEKEIQRCPFLRNINIATSFSFSSISIPVPVQGAKGPIFEDGPSFDVAFKLFHGKDGVVPLSGRSDFHAEYRKPKPAPVFNPLAANAATISLSALGGPFSFGSFSEKWKKQQKRPEGFDPRDTSSQKENPSKHEAVGNDWLEKGNCPISKSYRAVSQVLPLVAKTLQPPPGIRYKCPPFIVDARAALARTAFAKNVRPQPLPAKMLVIALLGIAANVPLGVWRVHTVKFSLSWFVAVHAAVPFIAMLRKSVMIPEAAMALTFGASFLGQVIGSRAERIRLKAVAERLAPKTVYMGEMPGSDDSQLDGVVNGNYCGKEETIMDSISTKVGISSPKAGVCF